MTSNDSRDFLQRLRQRKLVRWTLAYLAGAWGLLEGLALLAGSFGWPPAVMRAATVVLAFSGMGVLILAWYHGERGRQRVGAVEMMLLTIIVGAGATAAVYASRSAPETAPGSTADGDLENPTRAAVAVLPFVSLPRDTATEYFSEGITEELLSALGRIPGLRVAGRASSFAFQGRPVTPSEIGEQLGVGSIVEGTVRREGNLVRIHVRLTDATSGYQVWAEAYERDVSVVLQVQAEIATAIASALQLRLAATRTVAQGSYEPEALDRYLRGRQLWNRRTPGTLYEAAEYFESAIERDSTFALAYSGLADCYTLLPNYANASPEMFDRAVLMAREAVRLGPELAEAHASLGYALLWGEWAFEEAGRHFDRALELNPNYVSGRQWHAEYLLSVGRLPEAVAEAARAADGDPLSLIVQADAAGALYYAGRYDAAAERIARLRVIDPDFIGVPFFQHRIARARGDLGAAEAAARKVIELTGGAPVGWAMLAEVYALQRKPEEVRELVTRIEQDSHTTERVLMIAYLSSGDTAAALASLQKAVESGILPPWVFARDPQLDPLRSTPEFRALAQRFRVPR